MAQFTLHSHPDGPDGWKAVIGLEELGLTYERKPEEPNREGRTPTLVDHKNGDFTVWGSSAILLYLVDEYDKEKKIDVADRKEQALLNQWLFFQESGDHSKHEKLRILNVLEETLSKQEYLVGGKPTIADLSFVPHHEALKSEEGINFTNQYPAIAQWYKKLSERPSIKKIDALKAAAQ